MSVRSFYVGSHPFVIMLPVTFASLMKGAQMHTYSMYSLGGVVYLYDYTL